jgi:hypothetical protein
MLEQNSAMPTPVPVAFLLCDQISVDSSTGKKTIVGVFDRIWVGRFPANHRPVWLFVRVIDCEGQYPVRIEYVQVSNQTILGRAEGIANSADRHYYTDFILQLPVIPLPERGEYEFRLWMSNRFISSVRLTALPLNEMEGQS